MHIKFFSIEYTKLNDIIKSNHKINIRRDLIMSFYKKMVSVCAAVALSTSIIPVIPVSADTGMTRYEAERQYTGGWADVVQNSIASGGYVVERIGGKSTDIGTVVFPEAELKIYVTASPEVRAQRRLDELKAKGEAASFEEVLENVKTRDRIDSTRKESPLRQADDAVVLDNSHMTIAEQKAWLLVQYNKAAVE